MVHLFTNGIDVTDAENKLVYNTVSLIEKK